MAEKLMTLKLVSVDANENIIQRSIAYANPAASDYVHKHFTEMLNALTNNTYVSTLRTTEEDITDATDE